MIHVGSSWQRTYITLGITEMLSEIGIGPFNSKSAIPKPEIRLKKWALGKNDIR